MGDSPEAQARVLANRRLTDALNRARRMAAEGGIPAARMALDDAMSTLDDIQHLIDCEASNA